MTVGLRYFRHCPFSEKEFQALDWEIPVIFKINIFVLVNALLLTSQLHSMQECTTETMYQWGK